MSLGPLTYYFGWNGWIIPSILWLFGMYYGMKIEKWKNQENVQTYREIVAFIEGGDVEAARAKRDKKKILLTKLSL